MEEFAHRKNIDRFERELAGERDPQRRKVLEDLLASERTSPWFPGLVAQKIALGRYAGGQYIGALAHVYLPFLVIEAAALLLFLRRDINN